MYSSCTDCKIIVIIVHLIVSLTFSHPRIKIIGPNIVPQQFYVIVEFHSENKIGQFLSSINETAGFVKYKCNNTATADDTFN